MAKDAMAKTEDSMMKDDAIAKHGSYITLADYTKDPSAYADSKKSIFPRELVPYLSGHRQGNHD